MRLLETIKKIFINTKNIPIDSKEFGNQLNKLIERLWVIQDRLCEIREFEKQWQDIFDLLKARTGRECEVIVRNYSAYRSYHWDKYHILISDLHSIFENEKKHENPNSTFKQCVHHLKINPVEKYINDNLRVHFNKYQMQNWTVEQRKKYIEQDKLRDAGETRKQKVEAFERLFQGKNFEVPLRATDRNILIRRVKKLAKRTRKVRNAFSHKYEDSVYKKYDSGFKDLRLKKIEILINEMFSLISDISVLFNDSSIAPSDFSHQGNVSDQIDMILFGSISASQLRFFELNQNCPYWEAREIYYKSNEILAIIKN
jgi:hypothetical protein